MAQKERQHGSYAMYFRAKCRCDKCREYQKVRVAKNRADRLKKGRLTHGTRSSYDAGCRCGQCCAKRLMIYEREKRSA